MTFKEQAETFMNEIATRKCDPVKRNTIDVYRSLLDRRILPQVGNLELANVSNKAAKALVANTVGAGLSPATINLAVSLLKQVVKSAVNDEGDQLYPRTWNTAFIDAPKVDPAAQKCPVAPAKALSSAVASLRGELGGLIALLAGTGLRVGEALSLMVGPDDGVNSFWDPEIKTLTIRTTMVRGAVQNSTKTKAGTRVVDLDPKLNDFMRLQFGV